MHHYYLLQHFYLLDKTVNIWIFSSLKEPDEYDYDEETYFKAIADLYSELPNEAIILNTICAAMVALVILLPCILKCDSFRKGLENEADVESDED